jgi:3-deoxy-7-phosphoheptulonate synthase
LGEAGLAILQAVGQSVGLPVVTEVIAHTDVETVARYADILQIGTRNMHNTPLLHAAGESGRPVLLKRGYAARLEEWLGAAEHIRSRGNDRVVLCERGVRGLETVTRYTLDINAVPAMRRLCDLPVMVDPSHAAGRADIVAELSRAAVAGGADGLLIEIHPDPAQALSDGPQSLALDEFASLMPSLRRIAEAVGRTLHPPAGR